MLALLRLLHPALKFIYFIRNILDRYFFVYCVVCFFFLSLYNGIKVCYVENPNKRNTKRAVVLGKMLLHAFFSCIAMMETQFVILMTVPILLWENQFYVNENFMKIFPLLHTNTTRKFFHLKRNFSPFLSRVEPRRVFSISTPKSFQHFHVHSPLRAPRHNPSLPPLLCTLTACILCTVDPDLKKHLLEAERRQ